MKNIIIEFLNFKISDKIISLSKKTARLISYCYKLNPAKIIVLDNAISPDWAISKKKSEFNSSSIKIATVGSTSRKEKGIGFLISALSLTTHGIELNIYGENTDLPRTDRYNNLTVNFYPFMEKKELICKLPENDVLLVPSLYDTFNLSLLEAMNIGMLFISSDRVGLTERFDDRLMKFVYKHYNSADLLDKLKMVINLSPEERNYYSDLNHKFSLGFTWDKVSNQYLAIFNE
jgi:glycosyltransferase involved in cell wall biosynthesis